jgi:hypothetical protein
MRSQYFRAHSRTVVTVRCGATMLRVDRVWCDVVVGFVVGEVDGMYCYMLRNEMAWVMRR